MPGHSRTGYSNNLPGETLFQWGMLDPFKYHTYANDFDVYTAAEWTVTETQAGATQAITAGDGGILLLTNTAADDDLVSLQLLQETFRWASTLDMFFKCRFKVSDATQSDVVMGLQITDTTPLDVTDGIFFIKTDGAATIQFRVEKDNTASTLTLTNSLVSDTYMTLGFWYEGNTGVFHVFQDDVEVGQVVNTNAPDDEDLTVTMAVQNGEAVAKTMSIDYVMASKLRARVPV